MNYVKIYADFLKRFLKPQKKLKVVFDCSNGTSGLVLKQLMAGDRRLTAYFINDNPDGNFPAHGPNPLKSGALKQIKTAVRKHEADLGIVFDADGDRAFFIDDKGRFINPDVIANLLIWRLKPKKIVIDVRTGWLVTKIQNSSQFNGAGNSKLKIYKSKTGHYFIKKLMRKTNSDFGAEKSGHYYFKNFFYADSGIFAAIETINAVSRLPYPLENFINLAPQYCRSEEINLKIDPKTLNSKIQNIKKYFSKKASKISELDGLTMEFNDWWFNIRNSNTEPFVRLNAEATNKKVLDKSIKTLFNLLSNFK